MNTTINLSLIGNSNTNYYAAVIKAAKAKPNVNLTITGLDSWTQANAVALINQL